MHYMQSDEKRSAYIQIRKSACIAGKKNCEKFRSLNSWDDQLRGLYIYVSPRLDTVTVCILGSIAVTPSSVL